MFYGRKQIFILGSKKSMEFRISQFFKKNSDISLLKKYLSMIYYTMQYDI